MTGIAIREPRPGDAEEIEGLITAHFTEGSSYGVDLGLDDPTFHVLVAVDDADSDGPGSDDASAPDDSGAILGVMAVDVIADAAAVAEEMYFFDDADLIPDADRYGLLEMGYVRDGATGRGIGGRLLERLHAVAADRDVDLLLADSWYHGGDDSPERLFDGHGYETVHREPLDRPASECSKCEVECTCESALAVRRIGGRP